MNLISRNDSPVLTSVGLATAQGDAAALVRGAEPLPPAPLPWPADRRTTSALCRPARGVDQRLAGAERWHALAGQALEACCGASPPAAGTPLLIASCNGAADSFESDAWRRSFDDAGSVDVAPWQGSRLPVVSAACASGLHALYLARRLLEAGTDEVVVLAADILSAASNRNFEALRILSPELQTPWQPRTEGFLAGEAAVALRLRRQGSGPRLRGPILSHDLAAAGGLGRALEALAPESVDLVVGQGTGPADVDAVELGALRRALPDLEIPLTTPLHHFGHTLGSSGLLSIALAALARRHPLGALTLPAQRASDGRRLAGEGCYRSSLVACRALGGACAVAGLGSEAGEPRQPAPATWTDPVAPGPIHHPFLRDLAADALTHRPARAPELLAVRLSEPLMPPARAVIGGRLLPSAVLEITPGFTALLIARAWGYAGPTLCLVGPRGADPAGILPPETHVIYIDTSKNDVNWN